MSSFAINFDLLKLKHAFRKTFQTRSGDPVTCVCIPIGENYIKETDANCYITLNMWERTNRDTGAPEHDQWGNSHAIQVQLPKDVREEMSAEERRAATPYLGSAKPLGEKSAAPAQPAPAAQKNYVEGDLPF